jgi:hypothetical protein
MSGLTEYRYETYGTARAILELPAGRVEVWQVASLDEFATDREITQAEYDSIRRCLQKMHDSVLMSSNPRGLVKRP